LHKTGETPKRAAERIARNCPEIIDVSDPFAVNSLTTRKFTGSESKNPYFIIVLEVSIDSSLINMGNIARRETSGISG
jgi:hypothetical protein